MSTKTMAYAGLVIVAMASGAAYGTQRDDFRRINNDGGFYGQHHVLDGSSSAEEVKAQVRPPRLDDSGRLTEASPGPKPTASRSAFSSAGDKASVKGVRLSDGWRDLGGEAGWIFEGR